MFEVRREQITFNSEQLTDNSEQLTRRENRGKINRSITLELITKPS